MDLMIPIRSCTFLDCKLGSNSIQRHWQESTIIHTKYDVLVFYFGTLEKLPIFTKYFCNQIGIQKVDYLKGLKTFSF